jgi:hypothetical protein
MNAIAAHKDELKNARGFEQQSGLGDDFRGVGGRVYHAPRHKLLKTSAPASNPPPTQINGELTWNQH